MSGLPGILAAIIVVLPVAFGCVAEPGSGAHDYLRDKIYKKMFVEIDYQDGFAPYSGAVELLKTRIQERCNKPGGVQQEQRAFAGGKSSWSVNDLRDAERAHRDRRTGGDAAVFYVQYVSGKFENNAQVLGVAYSPTSVAIFKQSIENAANPINPLLPLPFTESDMERSVLVHEFGHILGLVNLGTSMVRDHEDDGHRGHSTNKDSVMYYAVDSFASQVFSGPPPTQFDADDIADLRAAGGR